MFDEDEKKTQLVSSGTIFVSVLFHLGILSLFWMIGAFDYKAKEEIIPIDLTVVVNENLEGNENEPPPETPPPPPPRIVPRPPQPKPPVVQPKPVEVPKEVGAVEKIVEKSKPPREKPKPEPVEEKPKPPKKPAAELRAERLKRMQESLHQAPKTRPVTRPVTMPPTNGRTEKRPQDWEKLLNSGYKPGAKTTLDVSEAQRCMALIKNAFYARWDPPAKTAVVNKPRLLVKLGTNGRILGFQLLQSSGLARYDQSVLDAAKRVTQVPGLSADFIRQNPSVVIQFEIQ